MLIKYTGKYVKIYFIMKITYLLAIQMIAYDYRCVYGGLKTKATEKPLSRSVTIKKLFTITTIKQGKYGLTNHISYQSSIVVKFQAFTAVDKFICAFSYE